MGHSSVPRFPQRVRSPFRCKQMREQATAANSELGLTRVRSAEQPVWTLSGERQSVAITRATHFGAKLLLLDEPTAALSVRETRNVLQSIRPARQHGLGVLYIDHNMAISSRSPTASCCSSL